LIILFNYHTKYTILEIGKLRSIGKTLLNRNSLLNKD